MTALPPLPPAASRALSALGITTLEGVVACRADGLAGLPGIDQAALAALDAALDEHGWSFAESSMPAVGGEYVS